MRFTALAQSVEDLKNIVVNRGAGGTGAASTAPPVYLKDVADVVDTYADVTRIQRFNGEEAIGFTVTKQPDANSIQVADNVRATLARVQRSLPQGVTFKIANDTTRYTRQALDDVQFDLTLAVFITGTVLLLFLHSWRNTLIVLLAIPTSLISTFLVMFFLGFSLNLMSLMALALLIGILVDDSIVVLENIHRHLQLGEPPWTAALNGRNEIGLAAMAITFLDVVVYVPIAFMSGNIGSLFRQFGLTIAAATLFSLFTSFTLTPMLASRWLKAHDAEGQGRGAMPNVVGALLAAALGLLVGQPLFAALLGDRAVTLPRFLGLLGGPGGAPAGAPAAGALGVAGPSLHLAGLGAILLALVLLPVGWWGLGPIVRFITQRFPGWWERGYGVLAGAYRRLLPVALRHRLVVIVVGVGTLAAVLLMVR